MACTSTTQGTLRCCPQASVEPQTIGAIAGCGAFLNNIYYDFNPTQPCRFFRTVTTSMVDTQGTPFIAMQTVITNRVEKGVGTEPAGQSELVSVSGGDACPGDLLQTGGGIDQATLSPTHYQGTPGSKGCAGFNGHMTVDYSDEVTFNDVESAVQALAALINFGALTPGTGNRLIVWQDDLIVTLVTTPPSVNVFVACGDANFPPAGANGVQGRYVGAGNASRLQFDRILPPSPPVLFGGSDMNVNHFEASSGWCIFAVSHQTRFTSPGNWCRRIGAVQRDNQTGLGIHCAGVNITGGAFGCSVASIVQEPAGGTYIITPGTAPMQFVNIGYGHANACV